LVNPYEHAGYFDDYGDEDEGIPIKEIKKQYKQKEKQRNAERWSDLYIFSVVAKSWQKIDSTEEFNEYMYDITNSILTMQMRIITKYVSPTKLFRIKHSCNLWEDEEIELHTTIADLLAYKNTKICPESIKEDKVIAKIYEEKHTKKIDRATLRSR
jgi:hypothetical protein